jgi:glycosidase
VNPANGVKKPEIQRLRDRLREMYGPRAEAWLPQFARLAATANTGSVPTGPLWDQRDAVLIAYGDHVGAPGQRPLRVLRRFFEQQDLGSLFSTVHLLPFFPASSDDGFSVIDYRSVDPALGDWDDVQSLGQTAELMFDLVLNHVSQHSRWFQEYLRGSDPYVRYFHEVDPAADLSAVARPRSLPLLTEFATSRGPRHLWTTFSADQVDLNFDEPQVLLELAEVLLDYVRRGARIIRLDAVAYVGKRLGTSCVHLPQAHAVVKFFRDLLAMAAPEVLLLTETNVPHAENIRYFGDGDEAHMVYQFSLPPLLLDAWWNEDAEPLVRWLAQLAPAPPGTTFFNFTASHDGVGVRPLEGLISAERLERLIQAVRTRGGMISTRRAPDGGDSPYELNITYFDALADPENPDGSGQVRRFLGTQALMLALRGIPGVYFSSLFGAGNDMEGVRRSGQARRINRRKFDHQELAQTLGSTRPPTRSGAGRLPAVARHAAAATRVPSGRLAAGLHGRASVAGRRAPHQPRRAAAGPGAGQRQPPDAVLATSCGRRRTPVRDLLTGRVWPELTTVELGPYETLWLTFG